MGLAMAMNGFATITHVDPIMATTGNKRPVWVPQDTSYGAVDLDAQVVTVYAGSGGQFIWVDELGAGLGTSSEPQNTTNPQKDPFRLSKCLQWLLAPYFRGIGEFRGLDLNEIDIYEELPESITQFAVIDVAAITLANSIYFAPRQYSANLDGIELVAHELTHVKQWRLNGHIGFASAYLSEYRKNRKAGMSERDAYANISFEKQAAEYAASIKEAIRKQYGENPCEKYKP